MEEWELNLLKKDEKKAYGQISRLLNNISTEKAVFKTTNSNFAPIKTKIKKFMVLKKIKTFIFISAIVSIIIDMFFLKNIVEWTNFSQSMTGFIVFIFTVWMDKASMLIFKTISILSTVLDNQFMIILFLIVSLITLHFIVKNPHIKKR